MLYNGLEHSSISIYSHEPGECPESICVFHKRTNHHLRHFRQRWNLGLGMMERVCTHNVAHPDPDDISIRSGQNDGKHSCDACCIRFAEEWELSPDDLH